MSMDIFHSGFVTLIGKPNVGKSTLLNSIIGHKVAIVSDKPQTTRNKVAGIYSKPEGQIVFLDTPGIHNPKHLLGQRMVRTAQESLKEIDLIVWVLDVSLPFSFEDDQVAELIRQVQTPVLIVGNKTDLNPGKGWVEEITHRWTDLEYLDIYPVSAKNKKGIAKLDKAICSHLPRGPKYYPDDWVSDHPEWFLVSELIREKVLELTTDEVPHSLAVLVESMNTRENQLIDITANLFVERPSQRGILIGKNGEMIKRIGTKARIDIENLLGSKVNLQLWIKVKKDWRNKKGALEEFGYTEN
jgi:GTP-binding protein Era